MIQIHTLTYLPPANCRKNTRNIAVNAHTLAAAGRVAPQSTEHQEQTEGQVR